VSGFRSLRWRLTALIGAVVVLAVGATFVAIYSGTGRQLRQQIDRELGVAADTFASSGVPEGSPTPSQVERSGRRFISGQRFHASSRLLIVSLPSGIDLTNEPELLAKHPEPGDSAEDVAKDRSEARALLGTSPGYSNVPLADVGTLRLYRRPVTRAGHTVAMVRVGEPLVPVERAEREVARTFLVAGSATLLIALLAGYLVAARTAGPLRRMARIAALVDAGELSPRMAQKGPRDEVRALADSFDFMLDRLEDAFARQRAFAADASHELRTPLTVIRGQLEVLARQPNPSSEDVRRVERLVRTEILRMERLVEDLLVLARAEEQEFLRPRTFELPSFMHELLEGVRATADRRFELGPLPEGSVEADPDRLAQALRNLLRNAVDYTSEGGLVRLVGSASGDRVTLAVEDDGPGIPVAHRARVFDRFHRTDSARTRVRGGAGLGLAIARAVAEAHEGRIWASESPEGGARVAIELPGFQPAPAKDADEPGADEPRPTERVP
jgi:two-component system, OmpR family, sensor kinase